MLLAAATAAASSRNFCLKLSWELGFGNWALVIGVDVEVGLGAGLAMNLAMDKQWIENRESVEVRVDSRKERERERERECV